MYFSVFAVGFACSVANLFSATNVVGSMPREYYKHVPILDWICVTCFFGRIGNNFSFLMICVFIL